MDSIQNAQKSLNSSSFDGITNLRGIEIPDKIPEVEEEITQNILGPDVFDDTNSLNRIKLPEKLILEKIDLSDEKKRIDNNAFAGCENLSEIDISEKLLADIDIDSIFEDTNLDMDKLHEITDNYHE